MQFDWFTFGASLFNFILLLVLLRVFVFKRVVRAMETREKRLARQWDEAQEAQTEAQEEKERYRQQLDEIEQQRRQTLDEARRVAEEEREKELRKLREEMTEKRRAWEESLEAEHSRFVAEVRTRLGRATVDTVRATLEELADASLEEKMIDRFLKGYDGEVDAEGEKIQVYTGHPLPEESRRRLEDRLGEMHPKASGINVAVDEDLLCGVEIRFSDKRIGFSLTHHFDNVEERLGDILKEAEGRAGE
ncbi:MAG: F0F1 ATP synthase subunit delta [Spirochaetota bacterium]